MYLTLPYTHSKVNLAYLMVMYHPPYLILGVTLRVPAERDMMQWPIEEGLNI